MVLEEFYNSSGAKVNKNKTQMFFSKNVCNSETSYIGNFFGYTITKDLGKYMGMLLLHSRVNMNTYHEILEKVENRLSQWNASHLSLAEKSL